MLSLNDVPYTGLHGNRSGVYNLNISSYLSYVHERPASSFIIKCSLDIEKAESVLAEMGFTRISTYNYSTIDDSLKEEEFLEQFKNNNKSKYLIDAMGSLTYVNEKEYVIVQLLTREFSAKINKHRVVNFEVDSLEVAFFEENRTYSEGISRSLVEECYKRARQFTDDASPIIGIIGSTPEGMYVKEYNLGKNIKSLTDEELDLHYGDEFSDFHNKLSELLKSDNKGLIIFHGQPGTGKTHYIRTLLKDVTRMNKNVLYVPSNFIDSFLDPSFITFLSDWILEQNNPTIILLEDAESLVESRDSGVRSLGISNLLNITDGILNDILGTQIILTFNTKLDYIDGALLRPERLLARKEFTNLSKDQSQELIDYLKIDHEAKEEMSLADIYSLKNKRAVLSHNVREEKPKVGFIV
jgi:hypothetical protein